VVKEKLIALCVYCKCCLAKSRSHCFVCHNESEIEELCGCGICPELAAEYEERLEIRNRNRKNNFQENDDVEIR